MSIKNDRVCESIAVVAVWGQALCPGAHGRRRDKSLGQLTSCMDPKGTAYHTPGLHTHPSPTGRKWAGRTVWPQGLLSSPFLLPVWTKGLKTATNPPEWEAKEDP